MNQALGILPAAIAMRSRARNSPNQRQRSGQCVAGDLPQMRQKRAFTTFKAAASGTAGIAGIFILHKTRPAPNVVRRQNGKSPQRGERAVIQ
jgi:hypothetical protein